MFFGVRESSKCSGSFWHAAAPPRSLMQGPQGPRYRGATSSTRCPHPSSTPARSPTPARQRPTGGPRSTPHPPLSSVPIWATPRSTTTTSGSSGRARSPHRSLLGSNSRSPQHDGRPHLPTASRSVRSWRHSHPSTRPHCSATTASNTPKAHPSTICLPKRSWYRRRHPRCSASARSARSRSCQPAAAGTLRPNTCTVRHLTTRKPRRTHTFSAAPALAAQPIQLHTRFRDLPLSIPPLRSS